MKYIVANDIHFGGPHEMFKGVDIDLFWIEKTIAFNPDQRIYAGDNIDMNHCAYDKVEFYKQRIDFAKKFFGHNFISGNHELSYGADTPRFVERDHVLFTHGDYLFWGKERAEKYRTERRDGSNWLKRALILPTFDYLRQVYQPKLSDEFWDRTKYICDMWNCKTIVCGHKHPKYTIRETKHGITAIVLQRGINTVEV